MKTTKVKRNCVFEGQKDKVTNTHHVIFNTRDIQPPDLPRCYVHLNMPSYLRVGCVCPWWSRKWQQKQHLKHLICHSIWFLYLAKHTKTSINDLLTQITQISQVPCKILFIGERKKEERKKNKNNETIKHWYGVNLCLYYNF